MRLVPLLTLLAATSAAAQTAPTPGTCTPGQAAATITTTVVRAAVFNTGALFRGPGFDNGDGYLVPVATGKAPVFASALWLGGRVGGELRVAAARYFGFEFWPGPLGDGGTAPASCAPFDRIYRVSRQDVRDYVAGGAPTADLRDWPVALGAPVLDGDGVVGNYNLAGGDQPALRGDDVAWWLMNDVGNRHASTQTPPLGVEVRVEAYGFRDAPANATTFYRYTVTNRTTATIDSVYAGLFVDPDLGNADDDYVGTDTTTAMGYAYNGDNADEGAVGYGASPPAVGFQVALGPVGLPNGRDDDRDGTTDEAGERLGLTTSAHFLSSASPATSDPTLGPAVYSYLRGRWGDGTVRREYGNGYGQTQGRVASYSFSGDPVAGRAWSEVNTGTPAPANAVGDRRMSVGTGPFRLAPGASETVTFAIPYARGSSNLNSVTRLREVASGIRTAFAAGEPQPVRVGVSAEGGLPTVRLAQPYPNPTTGRAVVRYTMPAGTVLRATLHDVLGREVAVLADGPTAAAEGEVTVDASGLAAGVYRVRVVVPAGEQTLTLVVAR